MTRYLLSTHTTHGEERAAGGSFERLAAVEEEMSAAGAWVFSARLHDPDTATVVRVAGHETLTTDGPFAESKEHLAGFYMIDADDLDAAVAWAAKVSEAIARPIEVRPFAGYTDKPGGGG